MRAQTVTSLCFYHLHASFSVPALSGAPHSSTQASRVFALFLALWDGPFLSLEEMILASQPALLDFSLKDHLPSESSEQVPKQAKVCSPEDLGRDRAICLAPSSQDTETPSPHRHHSKGCPQPYHPQSVLPCPQVWGPAEPHWLLHHLCQAVIMNTAPKSPGLLVACCVAPPADTQSA